jgi:predicted  nucleic acid-binding Zn-ribbon protein
MVGQTLQEVILVTKRKVAQEWATFFYICSMSFAKLTTKEIEQKIDQFRDRTETLQDIIKEIKDQKAKSTLQAHLATYQDSIYSLRKELERRNRQ